VAGVVNRNEYQVFIYRIPGLARRDTSLRIRHCVIPAIITINPAISGGGYGLYSIQIGFVLSPRAKKLRFAASHARAVTRHPRRAAGYARIDAFTHGQRTGRANPPYNDRDYRTAKQ
jgi:hypothetical protein